jgi:hypothetical protein
LSRDRIINRKRSKHTIIVAAGVLVVTTAASAVAAASAAGPARQPVPGRSGAPAVQQVSLTSRQAAFTPDREAAELMMYRAEQRAAAARKAAARAAAKAARERAESRLAAKRAAARKAAEQRAAEQRAAAREEVQKASAVPAAPGSAQEIARSMLGSYGWSPSQFSCLNSLWAGESGWEVTASNPSTGAYGIPQALPGSKMASAGPDWQTDAATQIRWGLGYIKNLYGSPCGAWSHEQSAGWY